MSNKDWADFDPLTDDIDRVDEYLRTHGYDPKQVGDHLEKIARKLLDLKCIECGGQVSPQDYEGDILVCQACTDKRMDAYYDNLP